MLNKFADVRNDEYVQTTDERMRIEVIGQRLLTGRLAIAEATQCRNTGVLLERAAIPAVAKRTIRVNADETRLSSGTVMTGEQLAVQQDATPDTGPQSQQHNVVKTGGSSTPGFTDHGTVPVIGQGDPPLQA